MLNILKFLSLLGVAIIPLTALNPTELLNWCIDARSHKTKPGPEDSLHLQCSPWANRSCCTSQTTVEAHYSKMYNFDWNHCSHVRHMSDKCKKHFVQDLCFYECSPNVGPWVVKVDQKIRKERFVDVPLCESDCDAWFQDCSDDYTCTDNWPRNFDWVDGSNRCPVGSTCKTFREIYQIPETFCESVWDHSWKYTSNQEHCMRLWFDSAAGNPNDDVAKWKVDQLLKGFKSESNANTALRNFNNSTRDHIIYCVVFVMSYVKTYNMML